MRCPTNSELLSFALESRRDRVVGGVRAHVVGCALCQAAVRQLRESASALQSRDVQPAPSSGCLDEMAIADIVDGSADRAEHRDRMEHLAGCASCRDAVAAVASLLRDPLVAVQIARVGRLGASSSTRRWRLAGVGALTAAAAAMMLIVVSPSPTRRTDEASLTLPAAESHREQGMTTTTAPNPLAPLGPITAPDSFRWTSVPHADRYRVTLFDRDGAMLWQAEGRDTVMAPPASLTRSSGRAFLWKVEARTGWDRWVESELVEYSHTPAERVP